jgi:hypothetical protein
MSDIRMLDGKLLQGGLAAQINYILNPNAHKNTAGWITYANTPGPAPVNGIGGSPSLTLSRLESNTSLRGTQFELAKGVGDLQGQGASYEISIDYADQAKVLQISFDYIFSSTQQTGDWVVYIYDQNNGNLIQPAGYQIQGGVSGTKYKHIATFQTASNSNLYRVIIHRASVNTAANTLTFTNIIVGPQIVQYGAPVTDMVAYTPIVAGLGTGSGTATGFWAKRGDSLVGKIKFVKDVNTGSGSSAVTYTIPPGLSIDSSKLVQTLQATVGSVWAYGIKGSATEQISTASYISNTITVMNIGDASGNPLFGSNMSGNSIVTIEFEVPIVGWSSTVQMSNDTDTRVVAAYASASTTSLTASFATIIFPTIGSDTHSAYNSSTGVYTAPVPGYYSISGYFQIGTSVSYTANTGVYLAYKKNSASAVSLATWVATATASVSPGVSGSGIVYLNAGDTLVLQGASSTNATIASGANYLSISRLTGPSAIAASETVAVRATTTDANTIASGANATVVWNGESYDTHGSFASNTFTAPISGKYAIKGSIGLQSATFNSASRYTIDLLKNGSFNNVLAQFGWLGTATSASYPPVMPWADTIQLVAGDTLTIRITQTSGSNKSFDTSSGVNYWAIERIGN